MVTSFPEYRYSSDDGSIEDEQQGGPPLTGQIPHVHISRHTLLITALYAESRTSLRLHDAGSRPFFRVRTNRWGEVDFYIDNVIRWRTKGYIFPDHFPLWCGNLAAWMIKWKLDNILHFEVLTEDEEKLVAWIMESTLKTMFVDKSDALPIYQTGTATAVLRRIVVMVQEHFTRVQKDEEWAQLMVDHSCARPLDVMVKFWALYQMEMHVPDRVGTYKGVPWDTLVVKTRRSMTRSMRRLFDREMADKAPMHRKDVFQLIKCVTWAVQKNRIKRGLSLTDNSQCGVCRDLLHSEANCPFLRHGIHSMRGSI